MSTKLSEVKALSELDFSKVRVVKVLVGDNEIMGDAVQSVKLPQKGSPVWEVRYRVSENEPVSVIYAASTPIIVEAVEIEQEQEEVVSDDDE